MKSIASIALWGTGGALLFGGSFVAFSALSGTPLHQIAILKNVMSAPHEASSSPTAINAPPPHAPPEREPDHATEHEGETPPQPPVSTAGIGVLGSFLLPSPYSAAELSELSTELRTTLASAKRKEARNAERERELDEWERSVQARVEELSTMRKELEKYELELTMRKAELDRDESAGSARKKESFKELARFFEQGDPSELVLKLVTFDPADAALILRALDEERASQLVNALPPEQYQAYVKAYRESKDK